jgi:hypothetical protein
MSLYKLILTNDYKKGFNFLPDIVKIDNMEYEDDLDGVQHIPFSFLDDIKINEFYQFILESKKIQCKFYFFSKYYEDYISNINIKEKKAMKETFEEYFEKISF